MFRSPRGMVCRMMNRILVNVTCHVRLHRHADDMTKCVAGYLQTHHYHKSCCPLLRESSAVHFLHLNHRLPFKALLKNVEDFSPSAFHMQHLSRIAYYSTTPEGDKGSAAVTSTETEEEKLSIFQRFKRAYKEHGKVLICVHTATSIVWYSSFYAAVSCGLDVVPYLEEWGFSETIIKPFRAGGLGDFAMAYLMYKLATPIRYTVTLAGTNLVIKQLRIRGRMAPKSEEDSLRQLYEDGKQRTTNLRQERLQMLKQAREKKKTGKNKQGKL